MSAAQASNVTRAARYIHDASHILVTAGSGMSYDSGVDDITPDGFSRQFPVMVARDYPSVLEGAEVDFKRHPLAAWGYTASRIKWYSDVAPHEGYTKLLEICNTKGPGNSFVSTTTVDGLFEKAGFDPNYMYLRQGSYKYLQCIRGSACCDDVWLSKPTIDSVTSSLDNWVLTNSNLLPRCPKCHALAYHNANTNRHWISSPYEPHRRRYIAWLREQKQNLVVVEIGCGVRIPLLRQPCEEIVEGCESHTARLVRINQTDPTVPASLENQDRAVGVCLEPAEALRSIHAVLEQM